MKSRLILATAAMLAFGGISQAQTTTSDTAAGQNLTPAQQAIRARIQGERQTCRTQAESQGIKGEAIRTAVMSCMAKIDPDGAKRMGCAQAAHAQNLTGADMQRSMRQCMTGAG